MFAVTTHKRQWSNRPLGTYCRVLSTVLYSILVKEYEYNIRVPDSWSKDEKISVENGTIIYAKSNKVLSLNQVVANQKSIQYACARKINKLFRKAYCVCTAYSILYSVRVQYCAYSTVYGTPNDCMKLQSIVVLLEVSAKGMTGDVWPIKFLDIELQTSRNICL